MAATDRQHVTAVLFYIALGVFLYFVFLMVRPFLVPLGWAAVLVIVCLLYTSPSPRDLSTSRMPSSA